MKESRQNFDADKAKKDMEDHSGFIRGEVPSLQSQCIQVLKENVDFIEEVGDLQYDTLKPVLEMAMACDKTLMRLEDYNQHLMKGTWKLWEKLVKKDFFNKKREEFERIMGKMRETVKKEQDSHRQTKMA